MTSRWTKPTALHEEKYLGRVFQIDVDDDATIPDLLEPRVWAAQTSTVDGDRVRCINQRLGLDVTLVVLGVAAGGVILEVEGACCAPGTALNDRLNAAENAARAAEQAAMLATLGGPRPAVGAS
jgi:hypothetical protein